MNISKSTRYFVCKSEMALWCTFDQKISKTFQYFKVWIKSGLKLTFRPKTDSKHFSWKFQKVLVRISWHFVCKSEIAFWCTFDQKISKTFQYFKVWMKSGLKVTFFGLKLILNTFNENFKKYSLDSVETLHASQK